MKSIDKKAAVKEIYGMKSQLQSRVSSTTIAYSTAEY
jgi:hypothetical protein